MANKKQTIKITNINGIKYVNKYHYDKLEKKKVKKTEKPAQKDFIESDWFIKDQANVCAIMPIKEVNEDTHEIKTWLGVYEEITNPEITYYHDEKWNIDSFKINDCKFSKEYLTDMQNMGNIWFDKTPRIFLKKEQNHDNPGIFIFGNKLAFVLAPRVTN